MLRQFTLLIVCLLCVASSSYAAETSAAKSRSFVATVTVTEIAVDGTRVDLATPQITYRSGSKCSLLLGVDGGKQIACSLANGIQGKPEMHTLSLKLTGPDDAGNPKTLAAPKIIAASGQASSIFIGNEPGPAIEVKFIVERGK